MMSYDGGKVTVENDCSVVKRLLRMLQQYVELGHAAFKHAAEVAWYERTTYGCTRDKTHHILYRRIQ